MQMAASVWIDWQGSMLIGWDNIVVDHVVVVVVVLANGRSKIV